MQVYPNHLAHDVDNCGWWHGKDHCTCLPVHLSTPHFSCCPEHDADPVTGELPVEAVCGHSIGDLTTKWSEVTCTVCIQKAEGGR